MYMYTVQTWQTEKLLKSQVCHSLARHIFYGLSHSLSPPHGEGRLCDMPEDCLHTSRLVCHLLKTNIITLLIFRPDS